MFDGDERLVRAHTSERETMLSRYFEPIPVHPGFSKERYQLLLGAICLLGGTVVFVAATSVLGRWVLGGALLVSGLAQLVLGGYGWLIGQQNYRRQFARAFPRPTDQEVDAMLDRALLRLRRHSLDSLSLDSEDCSTGELPALRTPVVWQKSGISPRSVVWIQGRDGTMRFGLYSLMFLWLAENHLGVFQCDYDLFSDACVNEEVHEFFYQDITSISTHESSSALSLPNGRTLTWIRELKINLAGESVFRVTIQSPQLKKLTGAERMPENHDDRVIRILRKVVQEKKERLLG